MGVLQSDGSSFLYYYDECSRTCLLFLLSQQVPDALISISYLVYIYVK